MAIIKCANGVIVDVEVNFNAKYGYDVKAELVCEFCKNKYLINFEEIKSMIENQS